MAENRTIKVNRQLIDVLTKSFGALLKRVTKREVVLAGWPVPALSNIGDYFIAFGLLKMLKSLNINPIIVPYGGDIPKGDIPVVIRGAGYSFSSLGMRNIFRWIMKNHNRTFIFSPTSFTKDGRRSIHPLMLEMGAQLYIFFREMESLEYYNSQLGGDPTEIRLAPCPSILMWDELAPIKNPFKRVAILHPGAKTSNLPELSDVEKVSWLWSDADIKSLENMTINQQKAFCINFVNTRLEKVGLVISNRLHGHIIPSILGIKNVFLRGVFHKNESYYYSWGRLYPNAIYADVQESIVKRALKKKG